MDEFNGNKKHGDGNNIVGEDCPELNDTNLNLGGQNLLGNDMLSMINMNNQ